MTRADAVLALPGGFTTTSPGVAALASRVLELPIPGTPATAIDRYSMMLRTTVCARATYLHVAGDGIGIDDVTEAMQPPSLDERIIRALTAVHHRAARTALQHPVEQSLAYLEDHAWGQSRWAQYWGTADAALADHHDQLRDLLTRWCLEAQPVETVAEHSLQLDLPQISEWRPGVVHSGEDGQRVLITAAFPVRHEHAGLRSAVAAAALGTPHFGRMFTVLRRQNSLAYGVMATPLVRGDHVAMVAGVSTQPEHAAECLDRFSRLLQAFVVEPLVCSPWLDLARLQRSIALSRLRSGAPLDPLQRCVLETNPLPSSPPSDALPAVGGDEPPVWLLHGPSSADLVDVAKEIWQ